MTDESDPFSPVQPGEPDERLIAAAAAGDEAAFEALYRRWRGYCMRLAARFGLAEDEALDVLQETFAYVIRKLPTLQLRARFSTFLYPVVKHLALRRRRRDSLLVPFGGDREIEPIAPRVDQGGDASTGDLEALLAGVGPEHREVLLLRFVDDLSLQEIAAALRIPLGTAKSRLHYALGALRQGRD